MTLSNAGLAFLRVVEALDRPFHFERSFKLVSHRVLADRFLVSIQCDHVGRDGEAPFRMLETLVADLGFPAEAATWIRRYQDGADVVHFGFEANETKITRKIYLEYVRDARQATLVAAGPVLVHRAAKWEAGAESARETLYCLMPAAGQTLERRLAMLTGSLGHAGVLAKSLLRLAASRASSRDFMLLDVADVATTRRSFDLRLYDAGLTLADVGAALSDAGRAFEIPGEATEELVAAHGGAVLGHLAAGQDGAGTVFATVYFGAQGR